MSHRLHCSLTIFILGLFLFLQPITSLAQRTSGGRQPTAGRRNNDTSQRARAVADAKVKSPGNAPLAPPPLGTPVLVKDINSGFIGSSPNKLTNINGTLYFTADNGTSGNELWKSDGTEAGTVLVKDIYTGEFNSANPSNLTNVNGVLYFTANDGTSGNELWKSDGTEAGTVLIKDIFIEGSSYPNNLTTINGVLYFTADDGMHGTELWKSDGTAAGTVLVKDINIDINGGSNPSNLTNVNGTLYFTANDGFSGTKMWKSDGTEAGTDVVNSNIFDPNNLTNVNGTLYFTAYDESFTQRLWKSDGTETGTVVVSTSNSSPSNLTNVNGTLYFTADDGTNGQELWKSGGTAAGTVLVKDIYTGEFNSSYPNNLTNVNGTLYFTADDGTSGNELWKSDGTVVGTVLVKDIYTGDFNSSRPSYLTNVNGVLYFTAYDGTSNELWKSNGTAAGTVKFPGVVINTGGGQESLPAGNGKPRKSAGRPPAKFGGGSSGFGSPFAVIGDALFFSLRAAETGSELFSLDLTPPPGIVQQPIDRAICLASAVNFTVIAGGTGTVTYQWKKDGVNLSDGGTISGVTTAGLTILSAAVSDSGSYSVVITDDNGVTTSDAAQLLVTPTSAQAVIITTQPTAQTVTAGQLVTFAAAADNATVIQWQVRSGSGNFWTNVSGATSASLTFPAALSQNGNVYRGRFGNCGSGAYTNEVALTVTGGGGGSNANTLGLVIRELRLRGNSLQPELDEYLELMNTTSNNITVTTTDGSAGWAVAALAADGNSSTILYTIPNTTVIPPKGHYLFVNNSPNGYSLGTTGDATYTADIADDSGVAVFNTGNSANFNNTTVIDAVGWQTFGTQSNLFREGSGLSLLGTTNGEYAWVRNMQNGVPVDTNDNTNDFMLVSPAGGTINDVGALTGTPGPESSLSPLERNSQLLSALFDGSAAANAAPNQVRDTTPVTNGEFGTLVLRRAFTNSTSVPLTKLRFRVIDITNAATGGEADLRVLDSGGTTIGGQPVQGLTLETPPAQPNGGGVNSTLLVGAITPGTPLAAGATVNVEFKLGVKRKGPYRFIVNIEAK